MVEVAGGAGRSPAEPGAWLYGELWRNHVRSLFTGTTPERVADQEPSGKVSRADLGALSSFRLSGDAQLLTRSTRDVRAATDDPLKVSVQLRGRGVVAQDQSVTVVEPGELVIYDTSRPYWLRFEGAWSCAVMTLPRTALGMRPQTLSDAMHRALPAAWGAGRVLTQFLTTTTDELSQAGPRSGLVDAGLALLAATIAEATTPERVSPAHVLRADILGYVQKHIADAELSHKAIAERYRLSPRSLSRMFEGQPRSLAEHIRYLRLQRARRDLLDPCLRTQTIASLANRWGFADAAHFSRLFKVAFGVTPSEARSSILDREIDVF